MITVRNRRMIVPVEERTLGVETDTNSSVRVFSIPRYSVNDIDLSSLVFHLDFRYEDGSTNTTPILDMIVNENTIELTWYIIANDIGAEGVMFLQIKANDISGNVKWNSFIEHFYVGDCIDAAGQYTGDLSALEALLTRCVIIENAEIAREVAKAAMIAATSEAIEATAGVIEAIDRANQAAEIVEDIVAEKIGINDAIVSLTEGWSSEKISSELAETVKLVNGVLPDENGNVVISGINGSPLNTVRTKLKANQPVTIVCHGDSMTWGYNNGAVQSVDNYPTVLQAKLRYIFEYNDIYVINEGHNSQTSAYGLSNFQTQVVDHVPDLVIMMWGLNDASSLTLDTYMANMRSMISLAKANNIDVLIATQVPIISRAIGLMYDLENKNFTNAMHSIASETEVELVDVYSEFNTLFNNNAIGSDFYDASGHPSDYTLVADIILANKLCDIYSPKRKDGDVIRFDTNQVYNSVTTSGDNVSSTVIKKHYSVSNVLPTENIKFLVYADKKGAILDFLVWTSSIGGNIAVKNFDSTIATFDGYSASDEPNAIKSVTLETAGLYCIELKGSNVAASKFFTVAGVIYNNINQTGEAGTLTSVTSSVGTVTGGYIKNGRVVTISIKLITTTTTAASSIIVAGIPAALFDITGLICKNASTIADIPVNTYTTSIANKDSLPAGTYVISGSYISAS